MTNSTISENGVGGTSSTTFGGGLYNDGTATLINSTVSGNRATNETPEGAGIYNEGTLSLINSTVANNVFFTTQVGIGGGISNLGTVTARNSIVAGNRRVFSQQFPGDIAAPDFYGTLTSQGYNLIGNTDLTTITGDQTGNILNTDARLDPLGDNGGPTQTHALLADSPAINAGNTATSPATDQRGAPRVGAADIGAFEFNGSTPTPTPTPTPMPTPTPNTAPSAANDAYSVNEDTTLTTPAPGVLANDTDAENNALTAQPQTSPAHAASFALNANGSFSYTPNANFNGTDSFTYTASDGSLSSNAATVTITVNPVNDAPVANGGSISTDEDTASSPFTLTGTDADNDALTFEIVTAPVKGTYNATTGIYTPNANANGSDSFTFIAKDASSQSSAATVSITIKPVNDAPTATAQSVTTDEDTAKAITLSGSDVEGDALTYNASQPSHGSVSCTGAGCSYTPTANYNGADSFTFKVNDGTADSAPATISITVNAVNDAPTANAQSVTTNEDTAKAITLSGSDIDGDSLTYTVITAPAHGTFANGFYTPAANYNGADSFTFKANDGKADSATATVSITVTSVNDNPDAVNDGATFAEDSGANTINVRVNDSIAPDTGETLTVTAVTQGTNGAVAITNGGANVSYTPNLNFFGSDSFTYTVSDGNGGSDSATVNVNVTPVNDNPAVAVAAGGSCAESVVGGTMNLAVGDVETTASGLSLSASSSNTTLVPNGNIVFDGSGSNRTVTITAVPQRNAQTATLTITVSDGQGGSSFITITVKVGTNKNETITGTSGADMILGLNGDDTVNAGSGNDLVCGGNGVGTVNGGAGDDTIDGGNGNDTLRGDAGNDLLIGGSGNDRLEGGNDNDTLTGGSGADSFSGGPGVDTATDFTTSQGDTNDGTVP